MMNKQGQRQIPKTPSVKGASAYTPLKTHGGQPFLADRKVLGVAQKIQQSLEYKSTRNKLNNHPSKEQLIMDTISTAFNTTN